MRIGLLSNLRAGQSGPQVSRLLRFLRRHPQVHHEETDSAGAVPEALSSLAKQNVDLLVLNGGDGTLQHALTEILDQGEFERVPLIAPLRGGRTNMTALDLGCRRDPVAGMNSLLKAVADGSITRRIERRPVLRVESSAFGRPQYGLFFGAGVIYRAIQLTHRVMPPGRSRGVFGAGVVTGTLLARRALHSTQGVLTPDKLQILIEGESVDHGEFTLVIASTLRRLFLRMNPFWGREAGPVRFTAMATSSYHTGRAFPGILRGRPLPWVTRERGYVSRNAKQVELRLECGYTVDGELRHPEPARVVTLTADRTVSFVRA